jgi:hypothetical protein
MSMMNRSVYRQQVVAGVGGLAKLSRETVKATAPWEPPEAARDGWMPKPAN